VLVAWLLMTVAVDVVAEGVVVELAVAPAGVTIVVGVTVGLPGVGVRVAVGDAVVVGADVAWKSDAAYAGGGARTDPSAVIAASTRLPALCRTPSAASTTRLTLQRASPLPGTLAKIDSSSSSTGAYSNVPPWPMGYSVMNAVEVEPLCSTRAQTVCGAGGKKFAA
jgi:hypothetical protein